MREFVMVALAILATSAVATSTAIMAAISAVPRREKVSFLIRFNL
jgi:hypothetical protein